MRMQSTKKLIPALFEGKFISEDFRKVLSLPARLGGLGILNPVEEADFEHQNSLIMTAELADAVFLQKTMYSVDKAAEARAKKEVTARKAEQVKTKRVSLNEWFGKNFLQILDLSAEKRASSWLTSTTFKEFGFRISK